MDTVKSNAEAYIVCARTSTKPPKGRRRRNSQSRSSVPCVVEKKKCRRQNESQISFLSTKIPFGEEGEKSASFCRCRRRELSNLCRDDDEEKNARRSEERLFFFFFPTSSLSPLSLLSLLSRVARFSPSPSRSVPISKARHFPWTFPRTEEADVVGDCDAPPCVLLLLSCRRRPCE